MESLPKALSAELFRHAVESAYDAIMVVAPDSAGGEPPISYVNPAFERLTGWTRIEAVGQNPKILSGAKTDESLLQRLHHGLAEPFDGETMFYRKDGTAYHAALNVSPSHDGAGQPQEWVVVQREISEHDRLEELERRVQERTRELEGFLYTVSHDFRAPLRAIMSASMILIEDYGHQIDRDGQAELKRQSQAAKKLGSLMDDLLRLSRLARQEMRLESVDLTALAREVAGEVASRTPGATIDVADGLKAQGDPALLRLMLQNLMENATKFSKKGEAARVEVGEEDGALFVRDEGIGFAPEKAEKIFGPFERLHTEAEYPGSGVGLANVKRIVDRHAGRVWAEGRPGEGATFWVRLGEPA